MTLAAKVLVFWLGASVGSFINVLVGRFGKKKAVDVAGRSKCDYCCRQLEWWENIPIISFLFLRGRCRTCHSPIPWEYPLVELATGIIYLLIFNFPANSFAVLAGGPADSLAILAGGQFWRLGLELMIATLLIVVFLFDLHYQIIPDWATLSLIGLTLVYHYSLNSNFYLLTSILTGLAAAAFFLALHLITRGRGMGLGDVKFSFFMGFFFGPTKTAAALYLAFLTGAIIGVILILGKKKKFGQQIAFGPFLVAATFIIWIKGEEVINLLLKWLNG